jgi:uncharacterized membrane protein
MTSTGRRVGRGSIGLWVEQRGGRGPIGLWLLLAFALGLRVWKISDKNLGLDESTSWSLATSPVSHLISWTAADVHPPLYYLLLKVWLSIFGDSLAALRSLSVVTSLLALYLLFRLAEGALPRPVCYAVMLWCTLAPLSLYQAQEARMYAPATAAVLGACLAYRRWIESGGTRRSALLLYAVSVTVALYLHYYTALAVIAIWLHFLIAGARTAAPERTFQAWKAWLVAHAGVAIAYAPWIPTAVEQVTGDHAWRPVGVGEIPDFASLLIRGLTFGDHPLPSLLSLAGLVAVGVLAVGGVCLFVAIARTHDERDIFFASVAYLPCVLALAVLPLSGSLELWWYVPYCSPLLVVAAARGLSQTSLPPRAVVGVLLAGTLALLPSVVTYYSTSEKDSDMRPIVAYLLAHARHGADAASDPVYLLPIYLEFKLSYYSRDAISYLAVPRGEDLESLAEDPSSGGHRVWLVADMHSRAPTLADLGRDAHVQPVTVPGSNPKKVQLFQLAPPSGWPEN